MFPLRSLSGALSGKEELGLESARETGEQRRLYEVPRATGEQSWENARDGRAGKRNAESGRAGILRREPGWDGGRQPHAELKNSTLRRDGKGGGGGFEGGKRHRELKDRRAEHGISDAKGRCRWRQGQVTGTLAVKQESGVWMKRRRSRLTGPNL